MRARSSSRSAKSVARERVQSLSKPEKELVLSYIVKHMRRGKPEELVLYLEQNARTNMLDRLRALVQRIDRADCIVF